MLRFLTYLILFLCGTSLSAQPPEGQSGRQVAIDEPGLRLATFAIDATPPIGSPLAYDEMTWVDKPLSCRGVVLLGAGPPIVLCSIDWIGVANGGQDAFQEAFAEAARTSPDRVSVHALHQHDAPVCDFTAERILNEHGWGGILFDPVFARATIARAAAAIQTALATAQPVSHLGLGKAEVRKVASNRRILGPDGKVAQTRYTSCRDPELRAQPTGTIDPWLRSLSFWNEEKPLAILTYYATHPQSYYRTGGANPDFPGLAREWRETATGGLFHLHFNGAGGNIGAGKWNDGAQENRLKLALRLSEGMAAAWQNTEKFALHSDHVRWTTQSMRLPLSLHTDPQALRILLDDANQSLMVVKEAAAHLAWWERHQAGYPVHLNCLHLGPAQIVFAPGELVVEYQLAAQSMAPGKFVALAAYGDYGPGYICLERHYAEGGYESSPRASRVAPSVEPVIMETMRKLLSFAP